MADGIAREWLRKVLQDAVTGGMKAAFYNSTAGIHRNTTLAYTTSGELTGGNYVAGGYTLTPTLTLDERGAFIDFGDLEIADLTVVNWDTILVYLPGDANRAFAVIKILPRSFANKSIRIQWPTADADFATIRIVR